MEDWVGDGPRVSRRRFVREGAAAVVALILAGCSPSRSSSHATSTTPAPEPGANAGRIDLGRVNDLRTSIVFAGDPRYVPEARAYVSLFPAELAEGARSLYPAAVLPALAAGVVVLDQKCPHLGCRVPFCKASQYFECPCHGAKFDRVGEYRAGPAARGMSMLAAEVEHGNLVIDTRTRFPGVSRGANTTRQEPAGPYCVG